MKDYTSKNSEFYPTDEVTYMFIRDVEVTSSNLPF